MSNIPKTKHALRKICSIVLSKDEPTFNDLDEVKSIFQSMLNEGYTPKQIQEKYDIKYTDFGMFLKKCLDLKIKTHSEALSNFHIRNGTKITNEKIIYYQYCEFKFRLQDLTFIPGYEKLKEYGIYHPIKNPNGLCRDHMLSKAFGWSNNIDSDIISHPANCQLITNQENSKKNSDSCITLNQLLERINNTNLIPIKSKIITQKTEDHKKKISESIKRINQEKQEKGIRNIGRPKKQ